MKKILIAGIGNIFEGDDAFGCEVIRQLKAGACPEEVTITDFGIRSYDLAYALTNGFDVIILVDSASRGERPGTVYFIEPEVDPRGGVGMPAVDAHSMNPVAVIQMAQTLGGLSGKLYLVGCEPAVLECEQGEMGLSEPVRKAVPQALRMIESLVNDILSPDRKINASLKAA
jgi:hydrogenase maturation protease